jgi:YgiT-type zinc finger domain-containing protein
MATIQIEAEPEDRIARAPFHHKGSTFYIDHTPVRVCAKCGEIYFPAEVYKRLEKIAENKN